MIFIPIGTGIFIIYCAHAIRMSWKERMMLSAMGILLILIGLLETKR